MTRRTGFVMAGAAVLAVAAIFVFRTPAERGGASASSAQAEPSSSGVASAKPAARPARPASSTLPELPAPAEPPQPAGSTGNARWIAERVTELEKLAWFDDAASLNKILAELHSPLPEVRSAALAATRAFGSKDAVPYLEQAENGTSDPAERKALADAIEYLKLPTLLEEQIGEPEPED